LQLIVEGTNLTEVNFF